MKYVWTIGLTLIGFPILLILWCFFQPVYLICGVGKSLRKRRKTGHLIDEIITNDPRT